MSNPSEVASIKMQGAETTTTQELKDNSLDCSSPRSMHLSVSKPPAGFRYDELMDIAKHPIQQEIVNTIQKILRACLEAGGPSEALSELVKTKLRAKDDSVKHWNQQICKTWFPTTQEMVDALAPCQGMWSTNPLCKGVHICYDKQDKSILLVLDHSRLKEIGKGCMAGPVDIRDFWKRRNLGEIFPQVHPTKRVYGLVIAELDPHNKENYRANKPLEDDVLWDSDTTALQNTLALFFKNADVYFPLIHHFHQHKKQVQGLIKSKRNISEYTMAQNTAVECHAAQEGKCINCSLPFAGAGTVFEVELEHDDDNEDDDRMEIESSGATEKVITCLLCADKLMSPDYDKSEEFMRNVVAFEDASLLDPETLMKIQGLVNHYDKSSLRNDKLLEDSFYAHSLANNSWNTTPLKGNKVSLDAMESDDAEEAYHVATGKTGTPPFWESYPTGGDDNECYGEKPEMHTFRAHKINSAKLTFHPSSRKYTARAPWNADIEVLERRDPCATWLVIPPLAYPEVELFLKTEKKISDVPSMDLDISDLEEIQDLHHHRGTFLFDQYHKDVIIIPPGHTTVTIYNCEHYQTHRHGVEKGTMTLLYLSYILLAQKKGEEHVTSTNCINFLNYCTEQLAEPQKSKRGKKKEDKEDDDETE